MTEANLQESLLSQTLESTDLYSQLFEPLMPLLSLIFIVSIVLTIIVIILFIVNIVQKQRQHAAIMRIDENLQLLVDNQNPANKPQDSRAVTTTPQAADSAPPTTPQ